MYIRTLPDFEGWHPLTWLHGGLGIGKGEFSWHGEIDGGADGTKEDVEGRSGYASEKGKAETPLKGGTPRPQPPLHPSPSPSPRELKECLTHNAKKKLADVQERYETDKATILHVLVSRWPAISSVIAWPTLSASLVINPGTSQVEKVIPDTPSSEQKNLSDPKTCQRSYVSGTCYGRG